MEPSPEESPLLSRKNAKKAKKDKKDELAKDKKDDEPQPGDSFNSELKDELRQKKDFIKEEKKIEKRKEKEEKRKLKEEERQKEKEEKQREKEEKRKAEKKREMRKERRRSFLKQGGATAANIESTIEQYNSAVEEEKLQAHRNAHQKPVNSPEVLRRQRELEQFLLNMPLKKLRGTTWKYYDIAPSSGYTETMLVLHGGGIRPEAMFEHILGLAQGFRVVCPWFPEFFSELDDYVAGLFLIIRNESIKRLHLFGIGFGAVVALHFLYRHPGRVISCSLTYGLLPAESKVRICEKALRKMDFTIGPLKRLMTGYFVKPKDIEEHVVDLTPGERDLWMKNFKKFAASKQAVIVRLETLVDFHSNFNYTVEDFSRWHGKMLLIESEDDEYYDGEFIQQMKVLFPDVVVHSFTGSGHLLSLIRGKLFVDLVLQFVLDEDAYKTLTSKTDVSEDSLTAEVLTPDPQPEPDAAQTDSLETFEAKKEKKKDKDKTESLAPGGGEEKKKKDKDKDLRGTSVPQVDEPPEKKDDKKEKKKSSVPTKKKTL